MTVLRKVFSLLLLIIPGFFALSQEQSAFRQYYLNPFIVNPAFTGAQKYPSALLSVKRQWVGIPDAPSTYLLSGNYRIGTYDFYDPKGFVNKGPLRFRNRIGIGAAVFQDNYGPSRQTGGNLSYGYHAPVGRDSELSFGLSVIATYHSFRTEMLKPDDPNDPYLLNNNDPVFKMNFNAGVLFHNEDHFIGFSLAKILPDVVEVNHAVNMQPALFLFAGHKFKLNNQFFAEPSVAILKTRDKSLEVDFHAKLYIKRLNWIALSYGSSGELNIIASIHLIKMLNFGYSYEYTLSRIALFNYGTHNIFLGVNPGLFGIKEIRESIFRKL